jgi:hypothetical protein
MTRSLGRLCNRGRSAFHQNPATLKELSEAILTTAIFYRVLLPDQRVAGYSIEIPEVTGA